MLFELHLGVAYGGGFIAQPPKVVIEHMPTAEGKPYTQPCNGHAELMHAFRIASGSSCRNVTYQVLKPALDGDWRVDVAHLEDRQWQGSFPLCRLFSRIPDLTSKCGGGRTYCASEDGFAGLSGTRRTCRLR